MNRLAWALLAIPVLAGCRGLPVAQPAGPVGIAVGAQAEAAAAAQRMRIDKLGLAAGDCGKPDWAMTGRVALSNGKDGGSGRIEWTQAAGQVRIGLTAPVTRQGWIMEVDAEGAVLQGVPDGPLRGTDPAALLRDNTGWDIPVAGLGCWVRGAWASETAFGAATPGYGEDGRLQRIEQAGWTIDYADWRSDAASGVELPGRITALRGTDRVRLVVDLWNAD